MGFPAATFAQLRWWHRKRSNLHQPRLASEGSRIKLPSANDLTIAYQHAAPLLDHLFADGERYVTRSVANHLHHTSHQKLPYLLQKLDEWCYSGDYELKLQVNGIS